MEHIFLFILEFHLKIIDLMRELSHLRGIVILKPTVNRG